MRGIISWSCVSCLQHDSSKIDIKVVPHDPGSRVLALWSFFLPSKRRVIIHTLCKRCIGDEGWYTSEVQLAFICQKRDQSLYGERLSWVKQQWSFWLSCSEVQRVNDALVQNGTLIFNLCIGAAIM